MVDWQGKSLQISIRSNRNANSRGCSQRLIAGRDGLLIEILHQRLLTLQLAAPAACHREQSIQIKPDPLRRERFKQIHGGHLPPFIQQLLESDLDGSSCDISVNQHQITNLIKQTTASPAVEHLPSHAAVIDQRRLQKITNPFPALLLKQIQPDPQLRFPATFTAKPTPQILNGEGEFHPIKTHHQLLCCTNRSHREGTEQQTACQSHGKPLSC